MQDLKQERMPEEGEPESVASNGKPRKKAKEGMTPSPEHPLADLQEEEGKHYVSLEEGIPEEEKTSEDVVGTQEGKTQVTFYIRTMGRESRDFVLNKGVAMRQRFADDLAKLERFTRSKGFDRIFLEDLLQDGKADPPRASLDAPLDESPTARRDNNVVDETTGEHLTTCPEKYEMVRQLDYALQRVWLH